MPEIAVFHPQLVHFVIALFVGGAALRILALSGRWSWMHPAATAAIVVSALASVAAVESGDQAHGIAERIPGVRDAVVEHEDWGKRTRNLFLGIAALELLGLALRNGRQKATRIGSAALGVVGLFFIYETGGHGGELVYSYAGGVGTRSGDPADVERLLVAGLYHQALADRKAGNVEDAARLFEEMGRRSTSPAARQLVVESLWRDRHDLAGARQGVEALLTNAPDDRSRRAAGVLKADILAALGYKDSARAVLEPLIAAAPNPRLQAKLDSLK